MFDYHMFLIKNSCLQVWTNGATEVCRYRARDGIFVIKSKQYELMLAIKFMGAIMLTYYASLTPSRET